MNTRGGCQKGGGGHKKVGNFWKGKYCFAKNKKKKERKIQNVSRFVKYGKDNKYYIEFINKHY